MAKVNFQVSLPVIIQQEGDAFVAHAPALDLSTVGDTVKEAQRNFAEAAQLFLEETYAMGTLDEVLSEMGWKKQEQDWTPPVVVSQESQTFQIPLHG